MQATFAMDDTGLQLIQTSAPEKVRKRRKTKNDSYKKTTDEKYGRRLEMHKRPEQTVFPTVRYKNRAVSHEIHGQLTHNR